MLYRYGLKLGLDLVRHGRVRDALPYLVRPVNYWRTVEYTSVWSEARFERSDRVLDVGSPKLLALYLAERVGAEVCATDIEDYFVARMSRIRAMRRIPSTRLQLGVEDGRSLSYPPGHFSAAYSISVLEHIPGEGDATCIQEIARVLAPGGRCVITVPFAPQSRDEFSDGRFYWSGSSAVDDGRVFYQRRYSEDDLHRRLIEPSGLRLRRLAYIGETVRPRSSGEFSDHLPAITGPVQPLLSRAFHTPPAASWRNLAKPLCAIISLEK
jgi:SAM-dependent methyltransferase